MKRCIVHIGMHKTGSTSIQSRLSSIENSQFVYARIGTEANHSVALYSAFVAAPERHHVHRAHGRDNDAVRAYAEQALIDLDRSIAAARDRTLLISGEDIGAFAKPDLVKLHDYIRARCDAVTVVGYVRPPAGLMGSVFQERVKNGSITAFEPKRLYRNYRSSFAKFDEVFGRTNVQLWKFESDSFAGGCVVEDFCTRIGIPLPDGSTIRLNESLSRQAVGALYTYSKFGGEVGAKPMTGGEGMRLGLAIGGSGKFRFSPDFVRPVLDANRADIEWMEARLGQELDERLGEHRPGDVRDEADLLRPDPETVNAILMRLGSAAPNGIRGDTPEEVVVLVEALRTLLSKPGRNRALKS